MKLKSPLGVTIKITNACNLNCDHCIAGSGTKSEKEISLDGWKSIINDLRENDVFFIDFTGGEPLIRDDWQIIARYAKSFGFLISLTTNATLIDAKVAKTISEIGFSTVRVSLDGSSSVVNNQQRKGQIDAFTKAIEGIKYLRLAGVPITVISTISKRNFHDMDGIMQLLTELGVDAVNFFPFVPDGRGEKLKEISFLHIDMINFYKKVEELKAEYSDRIDFLVNSPLFNVWQKQYGGENNSSKKYFCLAGKQMLYISEDGEVMPCPMFKKSIGNITHQNLASIWNEYSYLNDLINADKLANTCKECDEVDLCFGGCRAAALKVNGSISTVDPFCWVQYDKT